MSNIPHFIPYFSMIARSDIVIGALSISSFALQVSGSSNFKIKIKIIFLKNN